MKQWAICCPSFTTSKHQRDSNIERQRQREAKTETERDKERLRETERKGEKTSKG
jgi:hypothetical protein